MKVHLAKSQLVLSLVYFFGSSFLKFSMLFTLYHSHNIKSFVRDSKLSLLITLTSFSNESISYSFGPSFLVHTCSVFRGLQFHELQLDDILLLDSFPVIEQL